MGRFTGGRSKPSVFGMNMFRRHSSIVGVVLSDDNPTKTHNPVKKCCRNCNNRVVLTRDKSARIEIIINTF